MNHKLTFLNKLPAADSQAAQTHLLAKTSHDASPFMSHDPHELIKQFSHKTASSMATLLTLKSMNEIPDTVSRILTENQYSAQLKSAPHPLLKKLPWHTTPYLDVYYGTAEDNDEAGLSIAFCAIAETGTLMLSSSPQSPTLLNFLPTIHLVIIKASQILASYEQAWQLFRQHFAQMPRTINWITGPSRTADIEQTMQLGAHGPKQLYVLLIDDYQ